MSIKLNNSQGIHCKTFEQFKVVTEEFKEIGYYWSDNSPSHLKEIFDTYKENTVVFIHTPFFDRGVGHLKYDDLTLLVDSMEVDSVIPIYSFEEFMQV